MDNWVVVIDVPISESSSYPDENRWVQKKQWIVQSFVPCNSKYLRLWRKRAEVTMGWRRERPRMKMLRRWERSLMLIFKRERWVFDRKAAKSHLSSVFLFRRSALHGKEGEWRRWMQEIVDVGGQWGENKNEKEPLTEWEWGDVRCNEFHNLINWCCCSAFYSIQFSTLKNGEWTSNKEN